MNELDQDIPFPLHTEEAPWRILICLLGHFQVLKVQRPVTIHSGGKAERLLCCLGLQYRYRVPRDILLNALWPTSDSALAQQSLNSLVYSLHKLTGDALNGRALVLCEEGYYRLNVEAGVSVDLACFDAWVTAGDQQVRAGNFATAAEFYSCAVCLYRGDLYIVPDVHAVVERERLRACYLSLLAHLADFHYTKDEYTTCMAYAWRLLAHDAGREDAHRLVMRCYMADHGMPPEKRAAMMPYSVLFHSFRRFLV